MDWTEAVSKFPWVTSGTWVVVAVIDTWVDYTHEDLVNQMWDGSSCNDHNWDFLWNCIHWYDFNSMDIDPMAGHYHGTHVAWTIAAEWNLALL